VETTLRLELPRNIEWLLSSTPLCNPRLTVAREAKSSTQDISTCKATRRTGRSALREALLRSCPQKAFCAQEENLSADDFMRNSPRVLTDGAAPGVSRDSGRRRGPGFVDTRCAVGPARHLEPASLVSHHRIPRACSERDKSTSQSISGWSNGEPDTNYLDSRKEANFCRALLKPGMLSNRMPTVIEEACSHRSQLKLGTYCSVITGKQ
jgi:hypothetical protein